MVHRRFLAAPNPRAPSARDSSCSARLFSAPAGAPPSIPRHGGAIGAAAHRGGGRRPTLWSPRREQPTAPKTTRRPFSRPSPSSARPSSRNEGTSRSRARSAARGRLFGCPSRPTTPLSSSRRSTPSPLGRGPANSLNNFPWSSSSIRMSSGGTTVYISPNVEKILGHPQASLLEDRARWFRSVRRHRSGRRGLRYGRTLSGTHPRGRIVRRLRVDDAAPACSARRPSTPCRSSTC